MTAKSFLNRRRAQRAARAIALRSSRAYTPSVHLVGGLRDSVPEGTATEDWLLVMGLLVAFWIGYVLADERRVEQLAQICAVSTAPACDANEAATATTAFNSK